jgi:hypothetical protein
MDLTDIVHEGNTAEPRSKICSYCYAAWNNLDSFLGDKEIALIGYQVNFVNLSEGLVLFNHSCGTTLAIRVAELSHLYDGPRFSVPLTGAPNCPGYCLRHDELRPCPAECECAFIREILQIIKAWPESS